MHMWVANPKIAFAFITKLEAFIWCKDRQNANDIGSEARNNCSNNTKQDILKSNWWIYIKLESSENDCRQIISRTKMTMIHKEKYYMNIYNLLFTLFPKYLRQPNQTPQIGIDLLLLSFPFLWWQIWKREIRGQIVFFFCVIVTQISGSVLFYTMFATDILKMSYLKLTSYHNYGLDIMWF